jgi:predicted nucleic-acid-binding Zn-ribbon protein
MFDFGKPKEFAPVVVQGRQLKCVVCGHGIFWEHQIQLSTPLFNFLDLDEWNRVAHCAVCERCGYVHMFIPPHTVRDEAPQSEEAKERNA